MLDTILSIPAFFGSLAAIVAGLALIAAARWRSHVLGLWLADGTGTLVALIGWITSLAGTLYALLFLAGWAGLLLFFALKVVLAMAITRRRAGQRQALFRLLAAATKANVPLSPAVVAFAKESQGPVGRRALWLDAAVQSGTPLAHALALANVLGPSRERSLVFLGVETQQLAGALEEAANDQQPDDVLGEVIVHVLYMFWVLAFGSVVLTFVMLKIVPAFKQIFADFGTELPAMTELVITFSVLVGAASPLVILLVGALVGAFLYSVLAYVGWVRWRLPLPGRWMRGLETATVLRGLALTAEGQQPIELGVSALAGSYPDGWICRQLGRVGGDLAQGMPWWESLWQRRIISTADRSLLHAAARVGNVPWALRTVADQHRWRLTYRLRWWLHALSPPLLLAIGLMVGFIVIALLMPLVKIIEVLT